MAHHTVVGSPVWWMVAHPTASTCTPEPFQGPSISNSSQLSQQLRPIVPFPIFGLLQGKCLPAVLSCHAASMAHVLHFSEQALRQSATCVDRPYCPLEVDESPAVPHLERESTRSGRISRGKLPQSLTCTNERVGHTGKHTMQSTTYRREKTQTYNTFQRTSFHHDIKQ